MNEESKETKPAHEETGLSFKLLGVEMAKAAIGKMKALWHAKANWVQFVDRWGKTSRGKRMREPHPYGSRQRFLKYRVAVKHARAQSRLNRVHKSKQRQAHGRMR